MKGLPNLIVFIFGSIAIVFVEMTAHTKNHLFNCINSMINDQQQKFGMHWSRQMSFCALGAIFQRFIWMMTRLYCHTHTNISFLVSFHIFSGKSPFIFVSTILMRIPLHYYILLLCHYLGLLIKIKRWSKQANSPMNLKSISLQYIFKLNNHTAFCMHDTI